MKLIDLLSEQSLKDLTLATSPQSGDIRVVDKKDGKKRILDSDNRSQKSSLVYTHKKSDEIGEYIKSLQSSCAPEQIFPCLVKSGGCLAIYIALQIACNPDFREKYGLLAISESTIMITFDKLKDSKSNRLFLKWLKNASKDGKCEFRGTGYLPVSKLSWNEFKKLFFLCKYEVCKRTKIRATDPCVLPYMPFNDRTVLTSRKQGNIYEDYEYGLSDW